MNSDFREGKWPEIMIHFRSSLLSMPSIRLQDFVLFSWIVKSLHSFPFMNESGFMQYLNFESQHNLFLLQWVVESQAPANKAHEPPGFIFPFTAPTLSSLFIWRFFSSCLYLELSYILIFAVVIF